MDEAAGTETTRNLKSMADLRILEKVEAVKHSIACGLIGMEANMPVVVERLWVEDGRINVESRIDGEVYIM